MERRAKVLENAAATATLVEAGIVLMRQNLRRRHPDADNARIDDLLTAWLHRADDPIPGDAAGAVHVRRPVR